MRFGKLSNDGGKGARQRAPFLNTRACVRPGALVSISLIGLQLSLAGRAAGQTAFGDHLETGMQGQTMSDDLKTDTLPLPYSKGVRLVGHTDIWNRGGNINMAWIDNCAYVASFPTDRIPGNMLSGKAADPAKAGVAVIDVSDPHAPKPVRILRDPGAISAGETMHAMAAPDRKILVAGNYYAKKSDKPEDAAWLDVYDASTCTNPKLMSEFKWPEGVHMVTVSPNGKRVYGTVIDPFTGKGGLLVLDISDMAHPKYVGKFGVTRPDGTSFEFAAHEVSISPDERRIYAGAIASKGDDLNLEHAPRMSAEGMGPDAGGIYILDNSDIVEGRPNPQMRLVGTALHGGWHSPVQANIKGVPYLVGAGELGACPGAWPRISNIADDKHPVIEGEFKLAMNRKENCPPPGKIESATRGITGGPGTATSHFNDVDDSINTRLGLFPFAWAGLRIADLRDPSHPVEVGYFKPGDFCGSHVHYTAKTGQIWFDCANSGFFVIELKPEVRKSLGLTAGK